MVSLDPAAPCWLVICPARASFTSPGGCEPPTACSGSCCRLWARLERCHLRRPTRHSDPVAAYRLQTLLGLEEPPERARPSERLPGGASAHPTNVSRQPPVGRAADSRGTPEAGHRDRAGDGLQVSGPPPDAAVADLAHVPRQPPSDPRLRGLLRRPHRDVQGLVRLRGPGARGGASFTSTSPTPPRPPWTARQLVEACPWETAPRYVLRDRDAVYGVAFSNRVQTMGIHEVKTAPRPVQRQRERLLTNVPYYGVWPSLTRNN